MNETQPKALVRIVFADSGRGLWRDAELLQDIAREIGVVTQLVPYAPVTESQYQWSRRWHKVRQCLPDLLVRSWHFFQHKRLLFSRSGQSGLTIHLQNISPRHLRHSGQHWLIPNLEWFRTELEYLLPVVDRVLCKTKDAVERLRPLHSQVMYTGFSSTGLPQSLSESLSYDQVLHVAGNNRKKGTAAIMALWQQNPQWPMLHLVIDRHRQPEQCPDNMTLYRQISDEQLIQLRRRCGIVLAPSEAEGFGHVLVEGMAWGGIVVTVDAPPMNELVSAERGICVPWERTQPCRLGSQYFVDLKSLEEALQRLFASDSQSLMQRSVQAHQWVRENHEGFRQRLRRLLQEDLNHP